MASRLFRRVWGVFNDGPPDLDAIFRRLFGGKKRTMSPGGPSRGGVGMSYAMIGIVLLVFLALWALMGFYVIKPAEQAVVTRFGRYVETTGPGLHWLPPVIEAKHVENVDRVMTLGLDQLMLTEGENIVSVAFAVQYRIGKIEDYLFNVANPVNSLQQVLDSAVRQVIGHSKLDNILTTGRALISDQVREEVDRLLKRYRTGLVVVDVAMQPAKAPDQVKESFDDVIKAREDKVRIENNAQGYANRVVPVSEGKAARLLQEARANKAQLIFRAQGDVAEYAAILPEYKRAPVVTRDRMYLSAMSDLMSRSRLMLIDRTKGQNILYIPTAADGSRQIAAPIAPYVASPTTASGPAQASHHASHSSTRSRASEQASSGENNRLRSAYRRFIGAQS